MTARKRDKGRSRAEPDRIAINVRLTAEQRDALSLAAGGAPLAAWARETLLRAAGRPDLGIAATVAALGGAWATVTHGSNFCFESVTSGVPCIILGDGVARPISSTRLSQIETPRLATDVERRKWLCGLSYCQWTLPEFASGQAWAEIKRRL